MATPGGSSRAHRQVAAAAIAAMALLGAGCGDDEGQGERKTVETTTRPTTSPEIAPARTGPEPRQTTTTPAEDARPPTSPEDGPGGAGDEEPVSSQALLTGRAGKIGPRRVQVPPFIAIRVELRSADGRSYALRFGKRLIRANRDMPSMSATFDGLRPGRRLQGSSESGTVVIEASAEPGP